MTPSERREHDPLIGTLFADRYQVQSRLGKGGMAIVYKAMDRNLGRDVALKVLRTDVAPDPSAAKRLVREARAAAQLHHPHIITIHDVGEAGGVVFLVMEVLVGRPLSDMMEAEGAVAVERTLDMGEQIASALSIAHSAGIIHRDIKPENLFLIDHGSKTDFIKMLDFSIAMLPNQMVTAALTRAGSVFGTPHYMAPEQIEGKQACPQTDLYALGAVMYELIMDRPPFDGGSVIDILLQHVKSPPPPLVKEGVRMPNGLPELIHALLAKKPGDRPESAAWLRDRLGQMLADLRAERESGHGHPQLGALDVSSTEPDLGSALSSRTPPAARPPAQPKSTVPQVELPDLPDAPPRQFVSFGEPEVDERTMVGTGIAEPQADAGRPVHRQAPLAGSIPAVSMPQGNKPARPQSMHPRGATVPSHGSAAMPPPAPAVPAAPPAPPIPPPPTAAAPPPPPPPGRRAPSPLTGIEAPSAVHRSVSQRTAPRPQGALEQHTSPRKMPPPPPQRAVAEDERDRQPTRSELGEALGPQSRRSGSDKDTIAPEAAQPPKHARSLLWLAIPIGLVGLAGIALAIWLISTP
jgi:serine/threonine-protein kinase